MSFTMKPALGSAHALDCNKEFFYASFANIGKKIKLLSMALEKALCYCFPHVEIPLLSKFKPLIRKCR